MAGSKKLEVQIVGDASSLSKAFGKASQSSSKFGGAMMKVGKFAAIGLAGIGAGAAVAGKRMIELASDAGEVQSKMEVVFGKALPELTRNIDKFSAATGTSKFEMREQAANMGALLKPMLGSQKGAARMSLQFTQLATDLGSFNNIPAGEALEKIRAGLVGEAEPLRSLGVLLTEASTKEWAYTHGIAARGAALTEVEKVEARAGQIMAQTALAQGDATRTAGSMANQMKSLKTNVSDAATEIGMALLPSALAAVQAFNTHWPKIKAVAGSVFSALGTGISAVVGFFRTHWATISTVVAAAINAIKSVSERVWPQIQAAAAKVVAWYQGTLRPAIQNVIAAVTAIWNRFGGDITKIATTAFNTVKAVIGAALRVIQGVVELVLSVIRGDWSQAWSSLKMIVSNVLKGISAIINGFVSIAFQLMVSVGRAIIDGIIAGASGLGSRLKDALTSQISGAISGVKGALRIGSPSKVMADQIGKPLGDGIVQGMDSGLSLLLPAAVKRIKAFTDKLAAQIVGSRARLQAAFGSLTDKLMRAFDAETGGHRTGAEASLDAISARRQQEDLARSVAEAERALDEARSGGDAGAIADAERALARAREDVMIVSLEAQARAERQAYEDRRATMREQLEARLAVLSAHFDKEGATVKTALAAIDKLMRAFGITFAESGQFIGQSFVAGLQRAIGGAAGGAAGVRGALTGGNANPSVTVNFPNYVGDKQEIAALVNAELGKIGRRGGAMAV